MNENLQKILEQQLVHLQSLQLIMENEELLLNQHPVSTTQFQEMADKKRVLINTIECNEKKRLYIKQTYNIQEPYQESARLYDLWYSIKKLTISLKKQNHQNNQILQWHIELNQQRILFIQKRNSQLTYSANGLEKHTTFLSKKFSI